MAKSKSNSPVGNNIRRLRENNKWSQQVIAERLNISIPAYSKIETGVTDVNLSRLEQIAHLFEVGLPGLFGGDTIPAPMPTPEFEKLEKELTECEKEILYLQRKVIQLYEELNKVAVNQ
ncbi:helix-turn-helix transcriptional regulator [Mucilaginibacter sp.]|jgi:transcriptional regulator with XRE-family HTH domain|uniref:helix-turn-helix domain-containing protein n=1 Tax=Mucilaginibacter sp. TaxID=1882438 RepID=UPI002C1B8CF1|nr:helix-turn-helix transcriptional regulator [Mucilaginibacter sp.]HTI58050.1 helix-turn-helix transcriptional regulator [Mucilaginibacter sp.]